MTLKPAPEPAAALAGILRADRGRILAALIAGLGDFDLAEEALADATESALEHWTRSAMPDNPRAWLIRVARRKAIDRIRRQGRWRDRAGELALLAEADEAAAGEPPPEIPDERLRLIFACCHPALDLKSRVALTLRTLGGLTTAEIARAFLDSETTMGQRISRAKVKISAARIPFAIPGPELWAERLDSVLTVLYLIFNEGYSATRGDAQIRVDLCGEAIWLARIVMALCPSEAEVMGLLSLMLTTDARRPARMTGEGILVPLDRQDRSLWNRRQLAEGIAVLAEAMRSGPPGPFQIKAAISALHSDTPSQAATDWAQIVALYDALLAHEPTAVVRLNRAVALAEIAGPFAALAVVDTLEEDLRDYQPFHAARAELLARAGQSAEARLAYDRAIALSGTEAERRFLSERSCAVD